MKTNKSKSYTIFQMTNADIDQLLKLWESSGLSTASHNREKLETAKVLEKNPTSCFVAKSNGKIVGSILGTFNGRRAWIYHLAVHPNWQQIGLGSDLMQKAEKELIKQGATKILLGLSLSNLKVLSFYEKLGYSIMNDAILLEKDFFLKIGNITSG